MSQRMTLTLDEESPKFFLNSILRGVENNEFDKIESSKIGREVGLFHFFIKTEGTYFILCVWKMNVSDEYWTTLQAAIEIAGGEEE